MKIILKKDVEKQGLRMTWSQKDGYGRNFLIPQGYGIGYER